MLAKKVITHESLNGAIKNVQYAVRGKIVIRAGEIEEELKKVIYTNLIHYFNSVFC
jgi:hypothetical protein